MNKLALILTLLYLSICSTLSLAAGFSVTTKGQAKITTAPTPRVEQQNKTTITLSGSVLVSTAINLLAGQFDNEHEDAIIKIIGGGSSTAITAMLADDNVVGQISRPITEQEREIYQAHYGYQPIEIKVAIDALAIYVNKDNPLQQLSMAQLRSIFIQHQQGLDSPQVVNWGDLAIKQLDVEPWQTAEITLFGLPANSGAYAMMQKRVLDNGEFNKTMQTFLTSSSTVQGTGVDKNAIAFASSFYLTKRTHFVAVQAKDGHYYLPKKQVLLEKEYPLERYLYLYVTPKPTIGISAELKQLIQFLMADDTQTLIGKAGFYPVEKAIRDQQAVLFK